MTRYEHTQVGHVTGGVLLAGAGLALLGPIGWAKAGIAASLGVGAALFASLTVHVTDSNYTTSSCPDWAQKQIANQIVFFRTIDCLRNQET